VCLESCDGHRLTVNLVPKRPVVLTERITPFQAPKRMLLQRTLNYRLSNGFTYSSDTPFCAVESDEDFFVKEQDLLMRFKKVENSIQLVWHHEECGKELIGAIGDDIVMLERLPNLDKIAIHILNEQGAHKLLYYSDPDLRLLRFIGPALVTVNQNKINVVD